MEQPMNAETSDFINSYLLCRKENGELIEVCYVLTTAVKWYADERSNDKTFHVRSISPKRVLAIRVLA
jgi:hypothetical protein